MEVELEPRVKTLSYKVKGMSRESASQKAAHVLDADLRNHWSTATNTKEWILLELDEPCLLSHVRIYNKSVLEWEISAGLRYKPETFLKVQPRCEAPRRDMVYAMNYTPCRYVRISCLRGNPIAIFFIQLLGVPIAGLEPEFQPVVNYLLPHIISNKQDSQEIHLQLLEDMTKRLGMFLPHLEADLNSFAEAPEPSIRFLAMLCGPFYPILHIINERETSRLASNSSNNETVKIIQSSTPLTISSNFEPRRSRNIALISPTATYLAFRPDVVFTLLRKAYKDPKLGNICRTAARVFLKLNEPMTVHNASPLSDIKSPVSEEPTNYGTIVSLVDYSRIFGEDFRMPDDHWEANYLNVLDIGLVEEGILHVLYACASQPLLCSKLSNNASDIWSALPLVQALVPALRPNVNNPDQIDENFSHWKQPFVQRSLSQIVGTSSSALLRPLLCACAGYLSSFSPSHAKAACVLVDLCSGVLAPWTAQVVAKVDLAVELLEDLLGVIQGTRQSFARARAALKYVVLALSGNMDNIMAKYKVVKHQVLFLIEMLEPYLVPALSPLKSMIAFGNVSSVFLEKQEHNCSLALNVLRIAVKKHAMLPSLEVQWRHGRVAPSTLLSVLEPHLQLPTDIDLRKYPLSEPPEYQFFDNGGALSKSSNQDDSGGRNDVFDDNGRVDSCEDASILFVPLELNRMALVNVSSTSEEKYSGISHGGVSKSVNGGLNNQFQDSVVHNTDCAVKNSNLQADFMQLPSYGDCEMRAAEFKRLALDLHSENEITPEGHDAAIDALLLAAECFVNPCFMKSPGDNLTAISKRNSNRTTENYEFAELRRALENCDNGLKMVADMERKRDKIVLELMLEAAELDKKYKQKSLDGNLSASFAEGHEEVIKLFQQDAPSTDAITLVRKNQEILCNFVIQHLQREEISSHEILLQTLSFLLHAATKLFCAPELIVDIILKAAEYFNGLLSTYYYQFKEGNLKLDHWKLYEVQRRWLLLQGLIVATSGSDEGSNLSINIRNGLRFSNLIPPSAWLLMIPSFSSSASPLVRFLGWMAISRNAKKYVKEKLYLASDLSQLTHLLYIFSDDLTLADDIIEQKDDIKMEEPRIRQDISTQMRAEHHGQQYKDQSFHVLYPDISYFFPSLKAQFRAFGEAILEAVRLQLRSLPSATVPDLLCWFSDLCSWPLVQKEEVQLQSQYGAGNIKGFIAKNAKAVILYTLEAIVTEHMEAIVPEIPRLVQTLASLCRSSYCDVSFLSSVLDLLKPIISYTLCKVSDVENLVICDSCDNFESLCFDELFANIKYDGENKGSTEETSYCSTSAIFVLAKIFPDLSFRRKLELLRSSTFWADITSFEPLTSFHDYLCAYQSLVESFKLLLIDTSRAWSVIPVKTIQYFDMHMGTLDDSGCDPRSSFLTDVCASSTEVCEDTLNNYVDDPIMKKKVYRLNKEEIMDFSQGVQIFVSRLNPSIEQCCRVHPKLAKDLAAKCAECFVYSRCLVLASERCPVSEMVEERSSLPTNFIDNCWSLSLEGLAEMIIKLQEDNCWEVALVMLDCILGVPQHFPLNNVVGKVSTAVKNSIFSAPNIAWRLQSDKWLSLLFERGVHNIQEDEVPLLDLFSSMLGHPEPEERYIALKHLRRLIGLNVDDGTSTLVSNATSSERVFLSALVANTWDQIALLVSFEASLLLKRHAIELLLKYIPFAERSKLQSFLAAADSVLQTLTKLSEPTCDGPLTQISIALFATVCLYSPSEDIFLVPEHVWRSIEAFGDPGNGRCPMGPEKRVCQALCRLRNEGDKAKEILSEALSSSSAKQLDPDLGSTRESILQVTANLTSAQSYLEFFSQQNDQKLMELEEAEMEMELLQKEYPLLESSNDCKDWFQHPFLTATFKEDDDRLQQIKDGIKSLEKAKLRDEIIARRQKKLSMRQSRQKYLEEASIREAQLLQALDGERIADVEREIERQRLLEQERAKTRELQQSLDIEKEKQTQRELQRELEQVESGIRQSRRDFSSSSHTSRPRERYRDRDNIRGSNEGNQVTSTGSMQQEVAAMSTSAAATPTVVLSGPRQFSGQLPTILQSRDRSADEAGSYEENFDGSRDSGDAGSVGEADIASLEGQSHGFGSGQRHGSRGGKSRQIMERRDRDGRRESKWERKYY